jgi:TPR repeat protein
MKRFWLILNLVASLALPAIAAGEMNAAADNSAALALFRAGRYAAAYAALRPALKRGDPEAVFHCLIIRRNGLDGRAPASKKEAAALTAVLAGQADFMRQALSGREFPETTADAYRTALAQLLYAGQIPLDRPPDSPADYPDRQREEALALISSRWAGSPLDRYPPAQNFAAHLNLIRGGSASRARACLRKSAEAGDRLGMINLSFLYREGLGGSRDDLKAAHWARRAADSEPPLPRAMNEVGYFYETGRGVTRDLAEARAWYGRSAARGGRPGRKNAARLKAAHKEPSRPALDETIMF